MDNESTDTACTRFAVYMVLMLVTAYAIGYSLAYATWQPTDNDLITSTATDLPAN